MPLWLIASAWAEANPKPNDAVTFHAAPKALSADAVTEDWPLFLGPTHDGICRETKLLVDWPQDGPRLVWEMNKGTGYSSPSIVGRKLVFFHRLDDREVIECLDAETGGRYWQVAYPTQYRDRYNFSNGPRTTPVIDDGRVYTYGAEGKLYCTDLETGDVIWHRDLFDEFKLKQGFFGIGATPLVEGGLLIVNVGAPQVAGGSCVVAFDKVSGQTVWQTGDQWGTSYASPVPTTVHGQRRVLVFTGGESRPPYGGLLCIDPTDGKIDFRFPWRSEKFESVNAANPVVFDNQVFVTAAYQTGGALVSILPNLKHKPAWTTKKLGAHFATPIYHNGHLYGIDGRHPTEAALVCLNVKRGKVKWRYRPKWDEQYTMYGRQINRSYSIDRGSLIRVGDLFLCLGEMGHLLWLELTPKRHRVVSRTWLFSARKADTWTPPVISRGLLYVAQNSRDPISGNPPRLLCYDLRAGD